MADNKLNCSRFNFPECCIYKTKENVSSMRSYFVLAASHLSSSSLIELNSFTYTYCKISIAHKPVADNLLNCNLIGFTRNDILANKRLAGSLRYQYNPNDHHSLTQLYGRTFIAKGRHQALRNVSQNWLTK